jgi:signal transduction histidine kinase
MTNPTATILIVDDEILNRKLFETLLRHKGYQTLCAADGEQALAAIARSMPDLILLDVMMPGMNGYQVATLLKADRATAGIPIIMMTAQIDRSIRLAGLNAGVEDFLTKPIDQAELWLRVRNLLRLKEALQQSKDSLYQLLAHQEKTKEDERKRIARDIHDELGQNLLALRIDISMLHARTARSHPRLHQGVSLALSNIDATIKSVRAIINDLRPFELELGLQAAVEWQLKKFERLSGIVCLLTIHTPACAGALLDDEQTLMVFRILQESLSNIARHSQATCAEVKLSWNEHGLSMLVKDNGVGIGDQGNGKTNSFGIIGIRERVSALGGVMAIERHSASNTSANGTLLSVFIPMKKTALTSR